MTQARHDATGLTSECPNARLGRQCGRAARGRRTESTGLPARCEEGTRGEGWQLEAGGGTLGTGGLGMTKSASASSCVGRWKATDGACNGDEWEQQQGREGRHGEGCSAQRGGGVECLHDARRAADAVVHVFKIGNNLMQGSMSAARRVLS